MGVAFSPTPYRLHCPRRSTRSCGSRQTTGAPKQRPGVLNNIQSAMSYTHSFRYCKRCRRSTVQARQVVNEDGKRLEKHRCTKCDAETTRLLGERPHAHS